MSNSASLQANMDPQATRALGMPSTVRGSSSETPSCGFRALIGRDDVLQKERPVVEVVIGGILVESHESQCILRQHMPATATVEVVMPRSFEEQCTCFLLAITLSSRLSLCSLYLVADA
jgi:hypothetical protein